MDSVNYDVFISYRRESSADTARLIREALRERGLRGFLDVDDMGAVHFDERLLEVIERTPNFIVILSPGCLDRCRDKEDWLRVEIAHAISTGRNIVPLLKEGFKFPLREDLPPDIADLPRHSGVSYSNEYFWPTIDKLVRFLTGRTVAPGRGTPLAEPTRTDSDQESGPVDEQVTTKAIRPAMVLKGHAGRVWTVAFAPEGGRVLSSGEDRVLRLWDILSLKQIRKFEGHEDTVNSAVFSPDGCWIASAGVDRTIRLWTVGSGRTPPHRLEGHRSNINSIAFSPDGRYILSGSGGQLRRGTWVAGDDENLRLWDVEKKALLRCLEFRGVFVWSVAFSPNGRQALSGGWDKQVRLWDVQSGGQVYEFSGHKDEIRAVAFSPDGLLAASASSDGTVRVWDIDGKEGVGWGTLGKRRILGEHMGGACSLVFSPNGQTLLTGGEDKAVRVWDLKSGEQTLCIPQPSAVASIACSHDGHIVACGGEDGVVRLWELERAASPHVDELVRQARVLYTGEGKPQDPVKVARLLWQAAKVGSAEAQNLLGWMYLCPHGLPHDLREAALLFTKAAEQGYAKAQFNLAWRYLEGQGVPKSRTEASKWFRLAAEQGHRGAKECLERFDKGQ